MDFAGQSNYYLVAVEPEELIKMASRKEPESSIMIPAYKYYR
jgi:hypothetical protein